jgi:hypothetical protein
MRMSRERVRQLLYPHRTVLTVRILKELAS